MNRLKKHVSTLELLKKATPSLQKAIISKSGDDLIRCVCDCALNILKSNIPVTKTQKKKLSRHKAALRRLADSKVSLKAKRRSLQTGGFLGAILSTVLPVIASLLGIGK